MPDKWEYPWFAAWDLAFHTVSLAQVDSEFAKQQLWLLLFDQFMHPSGQIPAYEWEFSDLNPPVQAWAIWKVYSDEKTSTGKGDHDFLLKCYHKLMMNFCWWINKVDKSGNNIFEGGFLGLDNISVIDRSETLPSEETIEQSDGTGWMGFFSILMMRISLELAKEKSFYEELAVKFFEHFVLIAASLETHDNRKAQMWNDEDGFFYDVVSYPDNRHVPLKIRSMVGLIPLYAVDAFTEDELKIFPEFSKLFHWFLKNRSDCAKRSVQKNGSTYVLSMMNFDQAKSLLKYIWDPNEFRSEFGLRSLSKYHKNHPFLFEGRKVDYEPGEESISLKGGNSNWRGPIWFPTAYLLIDSLRKFDLYAGSKLTIQDHEGKSIPLKKIIQTLSENMVKLFKIDKKGRRPIHGDNGRGLGASHQTGWSGLISKIIEEIRN